MHFNSEMIKGTRLLNERTYLMIAGMPRSGTTLATRLICERLGYSVSGETHFFNAYTSNGIRLDRIPEAASKDPILSRAYSQLTSGQSEKQAFFDLLHHIHGASELIAEKTPSHLPHLKKLLGGDESVYGVIVIRNFADIIASLEKVPWNNASFFQNLRRCIRYYLISYALKNEFPDRIFIIQYEKLIRDSEGILKFLEENLPRNKYALSPMCSIFDEEIEPWKSNALLEPSVKNKAQRNQRRSVRGSVADWAYHTIRFLFRIPGAS